MQLFHTMKDRPQDLFAQLRQAAWRKIGALHHEATNREALSENLEALVKDLEAKTGPAAPRHPPLLNVDELWASVGALCEAAELERPSVEAFRDALILRRTVPNAKRVCEECGQLMMADGDAPADASEDAWHCPDCLQDEMIQDGIDASPDYW
jgi:hypothetical protein